MSAAASRSGSAAARAVARPTAILCLPSDTSFLGLVREVTKKMAEMAGFEPAVADQVALAVDEATTNVIEHAYKGREDRRVEVHFEDRGPELCVEVVDDGVALDPKRLPRVDVARFERERRTGGLGVHLMGKIMDSVSFKRAARRNVCCLVKRKGPGPTEGR